MNGCMEEVIEFYLKNGQLQNEKIVVCEMETIEKEFYLAYEVTQTYLGSIEDESSSVDLNENTRNLR